jgi:Uma2 family endonuclease
MIIVKDTVQLPGTLEEFLDFEPNDGFKYEWNDGELIKFTGMNRKHLRLIKKLNRLFLKTKNHKNGGELICENDVMLTGIQMRRPDLAYFNASQIENSEIGNEPIPEFAIEVISEGDKLDKVEEKIIEYYKAGVKVVWLILPERQSVHIYTSRRDVKICIEKDICSASPVLHGFEIGIDELFG